MKDRIPPESHVKLDHPVRYRYARPRKNYDRWGWAGVIVLCLVMVGMLGLVSFGVIPLGAL